MGVDIMQLFLMPETSTRRTIFVPQHLMPGLDAEDSAPLFAANNGSARFTATEPGVNLSLTVPQAQKLQVGQTFASVRQITDSCFAVRNTLFNSITPKPTWYDALNDKFITVKGYANQWIDDYSIVVTSSIPSSIMIFAPTFKNSANAISGILNGGTGALTPSELESIRSIFVRLLTKTKSISSDVNQYARKERGVAVGKLVDWKNNMSAAGLDLKSGTTNIQQASADLTKEIEEFNGNIEQLKLSIQQYQKLVATGAGLVGGGLFIGVIGMCLCFAFPVVGGCVLALGAASIISGATVWGVYQKKINDANKDILDYQSKIKGHQATILALGTLSTSMDTAVSNAELATQNMVDFSASWLTFGDSLQNTISAIDEGTLAQSRLDIGISVEDTKSYWEDVKNYAQKLFDTPTEVKKLPASEVA